MAGDERRAEVEAVARAFHDAYERLAPEFGYKTREASAVPWEEVPEQNRALMCATVAEVLDRLRDARRDEGRIVERDAPLLEVVRGPYAKALTRIAELEAQLEAARSPQGEDHEIRKTPDAMVGLVKGSLDKADKSCHHDSTRIDGTLDCNCLRCGADGYWHDGHRHDRDHPSGKVLFVVDCPQGEDHETPRLAKLADWLERDRREPDKVIAYAQEVRRLARVPPSRDGTVAVEDVAEWIDNLSPTIYHKAELRVRFLAEFAGSAIGEQTDHGGDR